MKYKTIETRPGYLGGQREQKYQEWNQLYGPDNWRLAWRWQNRYLNFPQSCSIYEESYFQYLKANSQTLKELVFSASDVYDDAPSNVNSGTNYLIQETRHTHIQDIAIRRSLERLGETFRGEELIQIRDKKGTHPLSMTLSPGQVPFYRQDLIVTPWLEGWWKPGTVECFYQSNRFLQVRKQG
jgi:hypothetical protein